MAGRVQRLDADVADDQHVAVVEAHVGIRRHAVAMHHRRDAEALLDLARGREMVGMGVGVDDVAQPQPFAREQPDIAVELAQRRVDQHGGAFAGTAEQIGLAAAGGDLVEDHRSIRQRAGSGCPTLRAGPASRASSLLRRLRDRLGDMASSPPGCGTTRI